MLFSSATFLFIFLPLVCAIYLLVRRELRNYVLLIASLIFYGWGEPQYLAIMLLTIVVNYVAALGISRCRRRCGWILLLTVLSNLAVLFYFKYFNFVTENINAICGSDISIIKVIMPIGISFYTFQALSYVVDVYRGEVCAQRSIYKLALYISLFPQLVAGPIVKYHDVEEQIDKRTVTFDKVSYGVKRFIIGLAKKMLIANTLAEVADKIFAQPVDTMGTFTAWIGAVSYAFQLYYDFSGYSDMAIGLGAIFGFKFMENFNYPYISKSITEFWRRWHISLSTWFKEYLYIPLGGNRVSLHRTYLNLFVVFLATGVWHGASWTFIIWGLWHGLFIIIERMTGWHKKEGGMFLRVVQHVYTMLVFLFGWVLFRADSLGHAVDYIGKMLGLNHGTTVMYEVSYYVDYLQMLMFPVALLCATPLFSRILQFSYKQRIPRALVNCWLFALLVLSAACIAASTYNPFIYFRF